MAVIFGNLLIGSFLLVLALLFLLKLQFGWNRFGCYGATSLWRITLLYPTKILEKADLIRFEYLICKKET